jgi:hypothetical protein
MHGRRTGRVVATTITAALAFALTGCAQQGTSSAPVEPAPASAAPAQPSTAPSTAASPSVAASPAVEPSAEASPAVVAGNPAKVQKGVAYRPAIDPAGFTTQITNPYMPLVPGTALTYDGGGEHSVFNITDRTKTVMGVKVIVVRDQGFENGALIEDTEDYFAQDAVGNVWYFGESTAECDGHQIISRHGSWQAGVDGAQPGVVMLAQPNIGDYYRQEYLKGEAEDVARVLRLDATVKAHLGTYPDVVVTEDFSRLEPTVIEHKKYAPGVGLVAEQTMGVSGVVQLTKIDPKAGAGAGTEGPLCRV